MIIELYGNILSRYHQFGTGQVHACPHCENDVTSVRQCQTLDDGVYTLVMGCGCRLAAWSGVPQWIVDAGIPTYYEPLQVYTNPLEKAAREKLAKWNKKVNGGAA
jgi:hypothetical protein